MTETTTDTGPPPGPPTRALRRCPHRRVVAGVAAGVADHFDVDPNLVRLAFAAATFVAGVGVPLYLAAWLLLPEEGRDRSLADDVADRAAEIWPGRPHDGAVGS